MTTASHRLLPAENGIGFLRVVLAAMVVVTHSFLLGGFSGEPLSTLSHGTTSLGYFAVQVFFAISGIVIAESWRHRPHLGIFLWHRLLRLAPALWVCLAVTAFGFTWLCWASTTGDRPALPELVRPSFGYVWHNLFLPRSQIAVGPFPGGTPWAGDWNGSLWTIFYEGACYLMIAGLGIIGLIARRPRLGAALLFGFVGIASLVEVTPLPGAPLLSRLSDTPGKQLALIFLAAAAFTGVRSVASAVAHSRWTPFLAGAALAWSWTSGCSAVVAPWILPPAVLWLATRLPVRSFERSVQGDYSYGIYLYGYPIQQVLANFGVHRAGLWFFAAASLVATLLAAILSWHLVERFALGWKSLFDSTWPGPAAAGPAAPMNAHVVLANQSPLDQSNVSRVQP